MFHQDTLCVESYTENHHYSLEDYFHMGICEVGQRKCLKLCCNQCHLSMWTIMSNTLPELYESRPVSLQLSIAPPYNTLPASSAELFLKTSLDINTIGQILARELKEAFFFWYKLGKLSTVTYRANISNIDSSSTCCMIVLPIHSCVRQNGENRF